MKDRIPKDEVLVEAVQDGDEEAFGRLVERHKDRIASYLYRRIGDRDWAEDLAQEVFLRAYRGMASFKADSRFTTWLYRIAHNLSIDFLKRRRLEPVLGVSAAGSDSSQGFDVAASEDDPEELAMRRELGGKVLETIRAIGPKYRDVFVLCALQGVSYEDAADVLGLSVKTVSSRLCRARKRFKERMAPWLDAVQAGGGRDF